MCGIVGIFSQTPVAVELYESLIHLQHRGQDAAGILTCEERFYPKHGLGLVREIFSSQEISELKGNMGIGHTRYPTAGGYTEADIQPLWIGNPRGIALAHNGNLVNYPELAHHIRYEQHRHLNSSLDSEVLLFILADYLGEREGVKSGHWTLPNVQCPDLTPSASDTFFSQLCDAIKQIHEQVQGSYSVVSLIIGKGLVAFRDPHGIRPLVMGERKRSDGTCDYIFASENTSFYALGFEPQGDLAPGEVVFVDKSGKLFRQIVSQKSFRPCVFEYVYFARPDATLDGVSVYRSRLRMGQNLARRFKEKFPNVVPDVVIPAPFTANTSALSFAHELGVRYSEGLYKNPFIGRTFIMPNQAVRARNVRYKLTPQRTEIEDKKVLIVDDSIVRGTTSREIVKMVREFGAKEIYFVSSCPPIKNPCFYGIDIPSRQELIAAHDTEEQIKQYLGVDGLLYQTEEDLVEAVTRRGQHQITSPCMACMNGDYVCSQLTEEKIQELELRRKRDKI